MDMVVVSFEPAKGAEPAPYLGELISVEVLDNATVDRNGGSVYVAGADAVSVKCPGAGHHVGPGLLHCAGDNGALSLGQIAQSLLASAVGNQGKPGEDSVTDSSSPPLPGQPRHRCFRFLH